MQFALGEGPESNCYERARGSEEGCKSLIRPILPISLFVPVNHEESDTLAGGGLGYSELDRGRER